MRKGSTVLGSLGWTSRRAGFVLLILPLTAAAAGALYASNANGNGEPPAPPSPQAARLQVEPNAPQAAPVCTGAESSGGDVQALRSALERRGESGPARLASRGRHARVTPLKVIRTRATWYGPGFHGRRTASGERFNRFAMTLASRHLPMGTRVRVVNPSTGRSAMARVNDRGPFTRGYTADLSQGLAQRIGMRSSGPIRLEILPKGARE